MKKLKLLYAILGLPCIAATQNVANQVIEYMPAPGQHINIESLGTPTAAQNMPVEVSNIVTLGGFGGYIVLGFENACANDIENPYGIDFTILGNSFGGSSEPGVVWVMKDENHNGIADELWYEIKGSQHFQSETVADYRITYFKTDTRDVLWKDNSGHSGIIKANSYNTQEYYPANSYFPYYPKDSVVFEGTLLAPAIDSSNPLQFVVEPYHFGYADVHGKKQGVDLTLPDNPYTSEVEGAGGDPIDISWAVDKDGNYVDLDSIHFLKIVTGNKANLGWIGELSTDVAYVVDVEKNPEIKGETDLLVVFHHKPKIIVGESLQLEASYFQNGRFEQANFTYSSQNQFVAQVNSSGLITGQDVGNTKITVSANGITKTTAISIVVPDLIEILTDFSSVYIGDTILLAAKVLDNNGDRLNTSIRFDLETLGNGNIIEKDGKSYFVAEEKGTAKINFQVEGFIEKTINFKILSEDDIIQVYFGAKNQNENLFPLQKIDVGLSGLNNYVENRENDYSELERHKLAHALVSGIQKAGLNFSLRDDENSGGKLYLYSVEKEGEFTYGWGGRVSPEAFAKAWIISINSSQYLNNFDNIEIADGDTIILYHESDITEPWEYTWMFSDKDSAKADDVVDINIKKSTCTFTEGMIIQTAFASILDREVVVDGKSYYSDENGKVSVVLESSPPLVIFSQNDAVLISNKIITSSLNFAESEFEVYPNPAEKELMVSGSNLFGKQIYIVDMSGKTICSKSLSSNHERIDIQHLNSGIFVLRLIGESGVKTFKFIKK